LPTGSAGHSPLPARDRQLLKQALRASSLAVSAGTFLECSRAITPSRTARGSISRCTCAETFPDLQSLLLGQMDHGLIAIDDIEIALLPHEQ